MTTSKKHNHCLRAFEKNFVTLHLQFAGSPAFGRHNEDERQTLGYLILEIWTIFKTMQMTSDGAHASCISPFQPTAIYTKGVSFLLVTHSWQSRASV